MRRVIVYPTREEKRRMLDQARLGLNVSLRTWEPETETETIYLTKNLIVTTGIESIRDLIGGTGFRPSHIELGTGTTAVAAADGTTYGGTVETPVYRDEITRRDDLASGNEFQLFLGLNDGNGVSYTEAGILQTGFQNSAAGDPATLVARAVFTAVPKTSSVELTLTWTWTLTAS